MKKVYLCIIFVRNESFCAYRYKALLPLIAVPCSVRCVISGKIRQTRGWKFNRKNWRFLPHVKFINITGGEPFIREDLDKIVEVAFRKAPRVVISTSGWFEERVLELARKFPKIGIRISIEGLSQKNDELRGRAGGFDKGLRTLLSLREMGVKDIGFGITVSNNNSEDMLSLYRLSKALNMEFATAAFHNSYYFHKDDNVITNRDTVCGNFAELINMQMRKNTQIMGTGIF